MQRIRIVSLGAAVVTALTLAACSDEQSTTPSSTVLAGLAQGESNDTTTGQPSVGATPGAFHGFVMGRGTGPDTFATAPRINGATITAYPHLGFDGDTPRVGDAVASVTTDANGFFQFPTIPGGAYVVTIRPPAASGLQGQYALTTISSVSDSGNWWVVLY
jgi:hypothetical protein